MTPEEIATHLRELSPKKRVPPSDALGEVRRRFMEKYGYWPSSLTQFDSEIDGIKLTKEVTLDDFLR